MTDERERQCVRVRVMLGAEKPWEVGEDPYGDHQNERGTRRVEQQIKLVELVRGRLRSRWHDLFEKNILADEHESGSKGTK